METNMDISILIYKLPEQLVDTAVKHLEEIISIPLSSVKKKKIVSLGLEVYFDDASSFNKAILEGTIEIFGRVYHIYPLVTNLTVHGARQYVNEQCLKILMSTLGKVLSVYCEKGPDNLGLTNNYRVVIYHPEIYEKIQSWPESSAKVFGNDVMFPITFFCRLCRNNGHTRHQCPKTRVHNTIKTELDSTFGEDVKPTLYYQRSFELRNSPKGEDEDRLTRREETVSDIPLDLRLKTTKHPDTLCLDTASVISQNKTSSEIKSSVRERKSFSYKSLVPPSLRDTGESFTKFCLKLVRTPNSFEVAKQYPRGIDVLLEQLSSYVHFNLSLMETRRNCEKRFIIAIDSLIPKLKFQLQSEKVAKIMPKQEKCTNVLDFSLLSTTNVVSSDEVTSIYQNHDSNVNLVFDNISTCSEKLVKKDTKLVKKEELPKPIVVVVDSKNPEVLNDLRRGKIPKQALNESVGKVTKGSKLYQNQATKNNSSAIVMDGKEGKFKGVSFAEMMGSALKKHTQTEFLNSTKQKVEKPIKKLKIYKPDIQSQSSCCSVDTNSAKTEDNISMKRYHDLKITDKKKTSKYLNNTLRYHDLSFKRKMQDKVVPADSQIKKKSIVQIQRSVKSLDIPTESTSVSEVLHKNELRREENKNKLVYRVRQGLIEIPFSKGVLTHKELKALLIHVRNKRNPYRIAERYSTDVGKIIQQLEQIVKKYSLELNPKSIANREIEWMVTLCKRLRTQESRMKNFDSRGNIDLDQASFKTAEKSTGLSESQFYKSSEVIRRCYQDQTKNKFPFTVSELLLRLKRNQRQA